MKEENENISFKFYPQVLVLVVTEMQVYRYLNYSPIFSVLGQLLQGKIDPQH